MAIKKSDIAEAVSKVLKREFTDCKVYSDETQERFKNPAFFVEILQHTSNESVNFTCSHITIVVTYFPKVHSALDNMDTGDRIKSAFGMVLSVGRRKLKIQDVDFAQTGENKEILQAYLRLEYYEATEREETPELMRELRYRHKRRANKYGIT